MSYLLIVFCDIPQVVSTCVVRLSHRHGIVCKVHIAVVAKEFRHDDEAAEETNNSMRTRHKEGLYLMPESVVELT